MEGVTLDELLVRARTHGKWPLQEPLAAAVVRPLLDRLAALHAQTPPVFHRDLGPRHVQLDAGAVTLLPFDAGRASGAYMSPEQAHGQVLEPRSDLFAAGLLLFELVCGRLPAQGVSALVLGELDAPAAVNPNVSPAMVAVLERALKLSPAERFASAQEMAAALDAAVAPASADALQQWAAALPKKDPVAAPERPTAGGHAAAPAAAAPARNGRRLPRLTTALTVVGVLGATLASLQYLEHRQAMHQAEYERTLRTCDVVTQPPGALIFIDGKLYKEHTPAVLRLERDREYTLEVRGVAGAVTKQIKNQKKVSVRLQNAPLPVAVDNEDEAWDAPPPPRRMGAPKAAPKPAEPDEQDEEVLQPEDAIVPEPARFDAESAPVGFTLTAEHEVVVPEKLCHPAPRGVWRLLQRPTAYALTYGGGQRNATGRRPDVRVATRQSVRELTLLAFDKKLGRVDIFPDRTESKEPTTLCAFALTDRSTDLLSNVPTLELSAHVREQLAGALVTVPPDARFLVRTLPAHSSWWHVRVSPVKPPYAVMIARRPVGKDQVVVLDQPLVDLPEGAQSVWFTVPVLERSDLKLDLSIEPR